MADEIVPRRRTRRLLVPLAAVGVAAWAAHRALTGRRDLTDGWQALPPAVPAAPVPAPVPAATVPAPPPAAVHARAVPAATAVATVTAVVAPATVGGPDAAPRGSRPALADGSAPGPDFVVKGKAATRIFHAPGGPYYTRARADVWFRTADDARAAGFTERTRAGRQSGDSARP